MYREIEIGGNIYKLRLTMRNSVALEKALGKSPIDWFMEVNKSFDENGTPSIRVADVAIILHSMLQSLHHGITLDKTYDILDAYINDGNVIFNLLPVFIEVFQNSGYLPKAVEVAEEEVKN